MAVNQRTAQKSAPLERSGWLSFSGVIMIVAGVMRIFDAIWAFRYNGPVVDDLHQAIFGHSMTTYGWLWLIVGAVLILSGILVMSSGSIEGQIARWIGIVAAGVLAVTAVSWFPYYPIWTLTYVGVAVVVIYGLVAHFGETGQPG